MQGQKARSESPVKLNEQVLRPEANLEGWNHRIVCSIRPQGVDMRQHCTFSRGSFTDFSEVGGPPKANLVRANIRER